MGHNHTDKNKRVMESDICIRAAENGHVEILKWAISNGYEFDEAIQEACCAFASLNGHLEILKWIRPYIKKTQITNSQVCENAALNGHFEVLKWAKDNGYCVSGNFNMCLCAAGNGQEKTERYGE